MYEISGRCSIEDESSAVATEQWCSVWGGLVDHFTTSTIIQGTWLYLFIQRYTIKQSKILLTIIVVVKWFEPPPPQSYATASESPQTDPEYQPSSSSLKKTKANFDYNSKEDTAEVFDYARTFLGTMGTLSSHFSE